MSLPLVTEPSVKLGLPRVFVYGDTPLVGYDVADDGRVLVSRRQQPGQNTTAILVQNWPALLAGR
jgi:hypothetical protein